MISNTVSLIFNLTFLIAMSTLSGFVQQLKGAKTLGKILQGMLFGVSAMLGMMHPLVIGPGLIFDGRSVMISICGLFFGLFAVSISTGIALFFRLFVVGGTGALMGTLVILSSAILGLFFHNLWHQKKQTQSAIQLWVFGMMVHVVMVLCMFTLPAGTGLGVIKHIGLPVLLVYPLATLMVGKILSGREAEFNSNSALLESRDALSKGQAMLRTLIDTIPDLVWMKDPGGVYLDCNHRFERFFGAKKSEIVGKTDFDFVDPEMAAFFRENDRIAILAGGPTANEERITFADDGHQEDLEAIKTPVVEANGTILGVLGIGRDISNRKRIEETLRVSEERFRMLSESVGEWIWEVDREGVYQFSNTAVHKILGYAPDELVGRMHYYDLSPLEDQDRIKGLVWNRMESNEPLAEIVNLNFHRDGNEVWLETNGVPVIDPEGHVLGYRGSTRDITRRKQAEESLREAYQFNEQILQSAQEGVIVYDPDLRYRVWNPYMETLSGTYARELLGKHPLEVYPFLRELGVMERLELALTGVKVEPKDYPFRFPKTGKSGWAIDSTAPLRNTKGEIIGVIRTLKDVTERRQAEEALKESEYFFRESQRAAAIGSYKTDFATDTWESSDILDEIFGIDANYNRTVQGWLNLIYPEDRAMMDLYLKEEVLSGKSAFAKEYRIVRERDSETRWVFGLGRVEFDTFGNPLSLIGTIQDITERKMAEEEKAKLEAQLQQAHKMEGLGVLVAGVAHNFNNILAIIMGTASAREQSSIDPLDLKAYTTIGKVCRRGRDVVRSLMQFARPTLPVKVPFELHALIREVYILLKNTTSNRIKIVESFTWEDLWVNGDAGTINHCFLNLFLNSIDAMPDGGTLILGTETLEDDWVEISIQDNGEGMPPDVLAHVIEPFFTTKEVGKGTGLGLSMTYGVIKAHGGNLEIFSQQGQGTTVKIKLPRVPAPRQEEAIGAPISSLAPMNVLLVDDDDDVRVLMKRMLKKAGVHQITTVPGGEEALLCIHSGETPNLIILDQNMPGMTGSQTMEQIRKVLPDIPILISSGQPGIHEWACFKRPNVGVISKPFDMEEIIAKLAQFTFK